MKAIITYIFTPIIIIGLFTFCSSPIKITVEATNPLDVPRGVETIELKAENIQKLLSADGKAHLVIHDQQTNQKLLHQWIDTDGDSIDDLLIFQASFEANETKTFVITTSPQATTDPEPENRTYARFVPERTDDFAWENDRVAFRTYGPTAQQMNESGDPAGTLSSGIDCWLKRVEYPIIDKWYKKYTDKTGTYHEDTGEGLDNYHVGSSRGCGGTGIWIDSVLYTSKNWSAYKILANGPIRTIFQLIYKPWHANDIEVQDTKTITIDLGQQLCKYDILMSAEVPNITAGITLHDKLGETRLEKEAGWIRYWEPLDDSELGTGIVINPVYLENVVDFRTETKDASQIFAIGKPVNNALTFYAGFGWKKSNFIADKEDWDQYLELFARRIAYPLSLKISD